MGGVGKKTVQNRTMTQCDHRAGMHGRCPSRAPIRVGMIIGPEALSLPHHIPYPMKPVTTFLAIALLAVSTAIAQPFTAASRMWVDGTSTIHDWTIETQRVDGRIHAKGAVIDSVSMTIGVRSLKSGKSGMDDKVYEALQATRHANIHVRAGRVDLTTGSGTVQATVTIAGTTKTLPVTVTRTVNGTTASYTGRIAFNMTDFKVSPPAAMLGAIKAGDAITLRFDLKTNAN